MKTVGFGKFRSRFLGGAGALATAVAAGMFMFGGTGAIPAVVPSDSAPIPHFLDCFGIPIADASLGAADCGADAGPADVLWLADLADSIFTTQPSDCGGELDHLRIVSPEQVAGIGVQNKPIVYPLCEGQPLESFGNAAGLRRAIADNPWLAAALEEAGYTPDEVVGIAFGANGSVYLYAHHAGNDQRRAMPVA